MFAIGVALPHDGTVSSGVERYARTILDAVQSLPGQIVVSWPLAGGLVAGGFLVAATTFAGQVSSSTVPQWTTLLFGLGAAAGLAHGGLLAYLGRDPARTRVDLLGTLFCALVWLVPGLLLSWVAALWIALTSAAVQGSNLWTFRTAWIALAWCFGAIVCAWAAWSGLRGGAVALRRWPDVRAASLVMSAVFAILLTTFLSAPPEIWFTELRVTTTGAVILAFGASVWIALPVMIAALRLTHRLLRRD